MAVKLGLKGRAETVVDESNNATAIGSGAVPVFSTPMLVALMETASVEAIKDHLAENEGSVGTYIAITHEAATPMGKKVWAEAELTEIDRRALTFTVTGYDEKGIVGRGTHKRFIIDTEKFLAKNSGK